jgi:hypothetical protein
MSEILLSGAVMDKARELEKEDREEVLSALEKVGSNPRGSDAYKIDVSAKDDIIDGPYPREVYAQTVNNWRIFTQSMRKKISLMSSTYPTESLLLKRFVVYWISLNGPIINRPERSLWSSPYALGSLPVYQNRISAIKRAHSDDVVEIADAIAFPRKGL